jgi:hypothetical protein
MMKHLKNQLDVDYIGGQGALTEDEEKALSEFFQERRVSKNRDVRVFKSKKRYDYAKRG